MGAVGLVSAVGENHRRLCEYEMDFFHPYRMSTQMIGSRQALPCGTCAFENSGCNGFTATVPW